MKTVAIVSGGMDSATLAYKLVNDGDEVFMLSFNYGQRHKKELCLAGDIALDLHIPFKVINLYSFGSLLVGNSLSDESVQVPHGHYADENMRLTVVPNRNAVMLACAFGVAASLGYDRVALGVHGGDHAIYPDCRPGFIDAFAVMEREALGEWWNVSLHAPFVNISKADIVTIGSEIGVPYEKTWSCYEGGDVHCGKCGTCVERKEAFEVAGVADPTVYKE